MKTKPRNSKLSRERKIAKRALAGLLHGHRAEQHDAAVAGKRPRPPRIVQQAKRLAAKLAFKKRQAEQGKKLASILGS